MTHKRVLFGNKYLGHLFELNLESNLSPLLNTIFSKEPLLWLDRLGPGCYQQKNIFVLKKICVWLSINYFIRRFIGSGFSY